MARRLEVLEEVNARDTQLRRQIAAVAADFPDAREFIEAHFTSAWGADDGGWTERIADMLTACSRTGQVMASIQKRPDGAWRARYRDAAGREHSRHFARKIDAQLWVDETTAAMVTGAYVAPGAGRVTFREYAEGWRAVQVHRPSTAAAVAGLLERHVYPVIGDRALEQIRPSDVQALVKGMAVSPSSVEVAYRYVSAIFKAATLDRRIPASPCQGIRLPKPDQRRCRWLTPRSCGRWWPRCPGRCRPCWSWPPARGCGRASCSG